MPQLLTVDPGLSSGVALGFYDDSTPYKRLAFWQPGHGLNGFLEWYADVFCHQHNLDHEGLVVVSERFVLLPTNKFTPGADALEPLRIEGAMATLGMMPRDLTNPRWQRAGRQYFMAHQQDTLAQKKIKARAWLKRNGLRTTGKEVSAPDADDVNSATLHAIAYLRGIRHAPTLDRYFPRPFRLSANETPNTEPAPPPLTDPFQ